MFVCTLAIQGAATRMMFSMSRDRHLPLGSVWGHVNPTFKTPANAAIAVGVLAALPILVIGPIGGFSLSIAATGLIYLSYFLCNLGVALARSRGWPRKPAWFNLGRWGMPVNILALIYGGVMILNIALWHDPGCSVSSAATAATYWNPLINSFLQGLGADARRTAGLAAVRDARRDVARPRSDLLRGRGPRPQAPTSRRPMRSTGEATIG